MTIISAFLLFHFHTPPFFFISFIIIRHIHTCDKSQRGIREVFIHVMAQIFKSGDLSNLIRSFDSISGVFLSNYFMRVKIYLKVQTQFHCPFYHIFPKYSDTASIIDQDQTAPKDCSRSALFASAFIKHSLIPQKNLFKFENEKVH